MNEVAVFLLALLVTFIILIIGVAFVIGKSLPAKYDKD